MTFWHEMYPYANRHERPSLHVSHSAEGGKLRFKWQPAAPRSTEVAAKAIATPTSFAALAALAASIATRTMHQYPGRLVRSKGPQQMRLTSHL